MTEDRIFNIVVEPEVTLLAKTQVTDEGARRMRDFYEEMDAVQPRDHAPSTAELAEFAGRICYDAAGRKKLATSTAEGYIANIILQRHLSVLEHSSSFTFLFEGVSRSLTHELVRHRHFSFSQESQRYVLATNRAGIVVPPAILDRLTQEEYEALSGDDDDAILEGKAGDEAFDMLSAASQGFFDYEDSYNKLEAAGLPRKQASEAARAFIPNAAETRIVMTGNVRSWMEFLEKRDSDGADAEIRRLAKLVGAILAEEMPEVFGPKARKLWSGINEQKGVR